MTYDTITQPEPPQLATATLALARVLAGDLDLETQLAVAGALAVLSDVHPPYPPHPADVDPVDPVTGIAQALTALRAFIHDAETVQDIVRVGLAARELTSAFLIDSPPQPGGE